MDKFFKLDDSDHEKEKKYNLLNSVFKKAKSINNSLLKKSNSKDIHESATILEAMLFYITSFSLSFLNNIYLNNDDSLGQKLNMRCILEGISVHHYLSEINDKQLLDMFRKQSFIFEWKIYKKYSSFDKILFYLEQIEFNYVLFKISADFL